MNITRNAALAAAITMTTAGLTLVPQVGNASSAGTPCVLGGFGRAAEGGALSGTVKIGKLGNQPLPCRGTNGDWLTKKVAGVTFSPSPAHVIHIGAATGSARGNVRNATHGYGQTRGRVGRATIGPKGAALVIKGVRAAANVVKRRGQPLAKTGRTHVVSIKDQLTGETFDVPGPGRSISIRGLAVIHGGKVTKTQHGVKAVALRLKVFPGTALKTHLKLGIAKATFKR